MTWNTVFMSTPAGGAAPSTLDDRIIELKQGIYERLVKEMVMDTASGLAAEDGYMRPGSAVTYRQAAEPTTRPNGVALSAADAGRLWFDTDTSILYEYSGSAWVAVDANAISYAMPSSTSPSADLTGIPDQRFYVGNVTAKTGYPVANGSIIGYKWTAGGYGYCWQRFFNGVGGGDTRRWTRWSINSSTWSTWVIEEDALTLTVTGTQAGGNFASSDITNVVFNSASALNYDLTSSTAPTGAKLHLFNKNTGLVSVLINGITLTVPMGDSITLAYDGTYWQLIAKAGRIKILITNGATWTAPLSGKAKVTVVGGGGGGGGLYCATAITGFGGGGGGGGQITAWYNLVKGTAYTVAIGGGGGGGVANSAGGAGGANGGGAGGVGGSDTAGALGSGSGGSGGCGINSTQNGAGGGGGGGTSFTDGSNSIAAGGGGGGPGKIAANGGMGCNGANRNLSVTGGWGGTPIIAGSPDIDRLTPGGPGIPNASAITGGAGEPGGGGAGMGATAAGGGAYGGAAGGGSYGLGGAALFLATGNGSAGNAGQGYGGGGGGASAYAYAGSWTGGAGVQGAIIVEY